MRRLPRISLKLQLGLGLAVLLTVSTWLLSLFVLQGIQRQQLAELEQNLLQHSEIANLRVRQTYLLGERMEDQTFLRQRGQELAANVGLLTGLPVIIYDLEGRPVGNALLSPIDTKIEDILSYAMEGKIAYQSSTDALDYLAPLHGASGQIGIVQFHYSLSEQQAFLKRIERLFLVTGLAVLMGGLLCGTLFVHWLTGRIAKLRNAAGKIRGRRFLQEKPLRGRDELGELSEDIYHMSLELEGNIATLEEEKRKLKLAIGKLQLLERQQKQFIGNISHEFKTPLTSIKAYVDLMDMYDDDPGLTRQANTQIGQEAQRLQEMVEKVLHLSSLEKYEFEQEAVALEMSALLEELCERMRGKATRHGVSIDTSLTPVVVLGDRESMTQIFINLLDNAIKYNVSGGSVLVESFEHEEWAVLRVSDTGIGIPEEAKARIFEPFYTVNKDRSRQSGGSGLGLALVKETIEKLQGELTVEKGSGPAEQPGSVFTVRLPLYRHRAETFGEEEAE